MSTRTEIRRVALRAMGSATELVVVGGSSDQLDDAGGMIDDLERRWSRFRADSEVSRINLAHGAPVAVSPSTIALVDAMVAGSVATSGSFDPTLLAPLVALGDGTSRSDPSRVTMLPAEPTPRGDLGAVEIDRRRGVVRAPAGLCLDPGGIGKGLAADMVAAHLVASGARGALVSIGGDIAMLGEAPRVEGWLVAVGDDAQLCIAQGGVATSGTSIRAWTVAGRRVHHLLDPQTGLPTDDRARGGVVEATVIAGDARWADVWTKAVMVAGLAALPALDAIGIAARAVDSDGIATVNRAWMPFAVRRTDEREMVS